MFAIRPSEILGVLDPHLAFSIDLACSCVYLEQEASIYKDSKQTANKEMGIIDGVMNEYRKKLSER